MTTYNKLSGQTAGRIDAISDVVFGVTMTLLVLEIKVPELEGYMPELELFATFWH